MDNKPLSRVTIFLLATMLVVSLVAVNQASANTANISCGQPTKTTGTVTVHITFSDKSTVEWDVAGILKTDTPEQKATKIRAAAPPTHANLETDGNSGTVAGGTSNVVSVTTKADKPTVKSMVFKNDKTGEQQRSNIFTIAANHKGLVSLSGTASGVDSDGGGSIAVIDVSNVTVQITTSAGMTSAKAESLLVQQLTTSGVAAEFADSTEIAAQFPGAEGDGHLIIIHDIGTTGLASQCTDTDIDMNIGGLIDTASVVRRASSTVTYDAGGDSLIMPDFYYLLSGNILEVINGCDFELQFEFNNNGDVRSVSPSVATYFEATDELDCYTARAAAKTLRIPASYLCESPFGAEVPTLSEWGLIIFSLLILTLITVVVTRRRTATTMAGEGGDVTMNGPLFVPRLFMRALTVTMGAAVVVLVVATLLSTSVPLRDIVGTILSAGIVAYMAHLWFVGRSD